jgi:hypothetical protein
MDIKLKSIAAAIGAAVVLPANAVTDYGLSEWGMPYSWGETVWQSTHGNASNSARSPIYHTPELVPDYAPDELVRRGLIPGAGTVVAFTSYGGKTFYQTGRGVGFSHLHAYDYLTGELAWKTPTWKGDLFPRGENNGPGPGVISSPAIVGQDGSVYIIDGVQTMTEFDEIAFGTLYPDSPDLWKYDQDGNLLWVTNVGAAYAEENTLHFQIFLDNDGDLITISSQGDVLMVDDATGDIIDVLTLPAERAEPCAAAVLAIGSLVHLTGESWRPYQRTFPCGAAGLQMVNPNLPAYDPTRNRLLFAGTEPIGSPEKGAAWAIDIVGEGAGKHFEIAWTNNQVGDKSATSWTLSNDMEAGYVTDGAGVFYSIATEDGTINWTNAAGQTAISPSVDEFGILVSSTLNGTVVGLDPDTGATLYERGFSDVASQILPILPPVPGLVDDGTPLASVGTQYVPSQGASFAQLTLSYGFSGLEEQLGVFVPIPHLDGELSFDKFTAEPLYKDGEPLFSEDIEGADGGHGSTNIGQMVATHGAIAIGIFCNGFNVLLPEEYKAPNCPVRAGAFVHRPASYCTQVNESISEASNRIQDAILQVAVDDQQAFDLTRNALVGMKVLPETLGAAEYYKEINKNKVGDIASDGASAEASLQAAADALLAGGPDALAYLTEAALSVGSAQETAAKHCKGPKGGGNSNGPKGGGNSNK